MGAVAVAIMAMAAGCRGLPLPVVLVLGVVAITGTILRYTTPGRRLLAIGGNRQAALPAGIDVRLHASMVFAGMGLLYGLAGLVLVARLDSAPLNAEQGWS